MSINDSENEAKWRDNWFAKNWLGSIPVARAIGMGSIGGAADMAMMDLSMLVGGYLFMQFNVFNIDMMDEDKNKANLEMLGEMAVGMTAGMFAHNNIREGGKFVVSNINAACCSERGNYESMP